jgi:crotonobetainyl-CoA:carnitine CoA-transferase CaiB-like acyl-CoA transferase
MMVDIRDSRAGDLTVRAIVPRLSRISGTLKSLGPAPGAHNREVYQEWLGPDAKDLESLIADQVI